MTRPKQPAGLRKLFSPPPDKKFLRIWNKNFIIEIYRNMQIFAFQMLWECSSWAFRNSAGQMSFLTHTRDMFVGKLVNWIRFSAVLQKYFFTMLSELRFKKWLSFLSETILKNEWSFLLILVGFETLYQKIWN